MDDESEPDDRWDKEESDLFKNSEGDGLSPEERERRIRDDDAAYSGNYILPTGPRWSSGSREKDPFEEVVRIIREELPGIKRRERAETNEAIVMLEVKPYLKKLEQILPGRLEGRMGKAIENLFFRMYVAKRQTDFRDLEMCAGEAGALCDRLVESDFEFGTVLREVFAGYISKSYRRE